MRRWFRGSVLAAVVGIGSGALWLPGSSGAEVAQPVPAVPEALGPNLLGNAGFEAPAITGGFRIIEPGTTLGTCRTIPGVTVKAGCWTSAHGFAGVDVVRTLWPAHQGKQSLDLNATFGPGAVMQAAPVTPGAHEIVWYLRRSPNATFADSEIRMVGTVTYFNSAGKVLASHRFGITNAATGGFVNIDRPVPAPAGSVAAVVMLSSDHNGSANGMVIDSVRLSRV